MIEFSFKPHLSPKFGRILKPVIPATIVGPKQKMNVFTLIDSGADISMIPYSAGEFLGFEFIMDTRAEVQGIGDGNIPYVLIQMLFVIGHIEFVARVGWALVEEVPFILGRLDVFQQLNIEFREWENKIILAPGQRENS